MDIEQYAEAYKKGYLKTVKELMSKGVQYDLAQEAAQSAWARGWERIHQLRDPDSLRAWVARVAFNEYKDMLRKAKVRTFPEYRPSRSYNPIEAFHAAIMLDSVKTLENFDLFYLHFVIGMEWGEISKLSGGTTLDTLEIQAFRLKAVLRRKFKQRFRSPRLRK